MIITVDARETALIDELRDNPIKPLADYLTSARKCCIVLDTDDTAKDTIDQSSPSITNTADAVVGSNCAIVCSRPNHTLNVTRLALGDATLSAPNGSTGSDVLLFERKTLVDFAASIRDGRYKEQSFRLNKHCELSNHNIVYIIEGDLSKYVDRSKGGNVITKKALYSAIFSMMFYKGFSVLRTMNIRETAELILNFADKYDSTAPDLRGFYYRADNGGHHSDIPTTANDATSASAASVAAAGSTGDEYANVFKRKERSSQITPDNIGEIMLSAVPCVSVKTASTIMREYKSIGKLLDCMKSDRHCLDNLSIVAQNGNARKISKICVENIFKYLLV